jgi:high-affinity nickel permease
MLTLATALWSCTALGLQHGVDWDHVAAISDVAGVQATPREATRCGFLYAAGHAATVGVLGVAAIALRHSVPGGVSMWMQRVVGFTLVVLGFYVFAALFSGRQLLSRGQAVLSIFDRLHGGHREEPIGGGRRYGRRSALSLGVLHGAGAETPTQLSMLAIAMNLGGMQSGIIGLMVFTTAMFASNMALTAAAAGMFTLSRPKPAVFRWVGAITAAYSLWIGIVLIFYQGLA